MVLAMQYIEKVNDLPANLFESVQSVVKQYLGDTFPSLAIAVIAQNQLMFESAWGWIDPEAETIPVTVETLFDLASVTKPFTATAFLSLLTEGKVALDDPLVRIVPEFGESGPRGIDGGQDPHSKVHLEIPAGTEGIKVDPTKITFRHLLTHTSGLAPWRDVYNAAGQPPSPPDEAEPIAREIRWRNGLNAMCNYPFVGHPGEQVRYSDIGLMLLGEAISRLHGSPGHLDIAVQDRVLKPLNLTSPCYNPVRTGTDRAQIVKTEDDPTWRKRRCWGEVHDENACGVGGVAGHAGLFSTVDDLAEFGYAWLKNDDRLGISAEVHADAVREHATDGIRRGLGWMLKANEDSSAGDYVSDSTFGHTGFTGPSLWIDPENELVIACLNNRVYPGREKPGVHEFRRDLHNALGRGLRKE